MKRICDQYSQPNKLQDFVKNDIFRKFQQQFSHLFSNPINLNDDLYVSHDNEDYYYKIFNDFCESLDSRILFFVGHTGTGKTTFIKHYFAIKTLGIENYGNDGIIIPISWDGKSIPEDYKLSINKQISNALDTATKKIYRSVEDLFRQESDSIIEYIEKTRADIMETLSLQEMTDAKNNGWTDNQAKLQKCKDVSRVESSSSIFKYAIEKSRYRRVILIVDDVETISQEKLEYIVRAFFKIFACLHNTNEAPYVKLLFGLRPHSYRFLKTSLNNYEIQSYGFPFDDQERKRVFKSTIPSVKAIFISRFEDAINNTSRPGNPDTWKEAKEAFYEIINGFDGNAFNTIQDLCHLNIRAISECFEMILSNRIWCQATDDISDHPTVEKNSYKFDIVRVVRTLSCGECTFYSGKDNALQLPIKFHKYYQVRPSFDASTVFIPNILADISNGECDILLATIIQYLESNNFDSDSVNTSPNANFITKGDLCDLLYDSFGSHICREKITNGIDFLFKNRVIRKSIICNDSETAFNTLYDKDSLYLTLKGSRLLHMLESDSVLLEIYREDINREYDSLLDYCHSSYSLVRYNKRFDLFSDLVHLAHELYINEDHYHTYTEHMISFPDTNPFFPITLKIIKGIRASIDRAQSSLSETQKYTLRVKLCKLELELQQRSTELNNQK